MPRTPILPEARPIRLPNPAQLTILLPFNGLDFMRQNEFVHDELVQEFYGLDSKTMSVDSVSVTKSGKMHRWTEADGYLRAQLSEPNMQAEVTRHFGLIYLVAVQPDASVELRHQVMRGLRATARLLKN